VPTPGISTELSVYSAFTQASEGAGVVIPALHNLAELVGAFLFVGQAKRQVASVVQIHHGFRGVPGNIDIVKLDVVRFTDPPQLQLSVILIFDRDLPAVLIDVEDPTRCSS